jgi:RimJ/RimL family protein N-acetyltransferase
LLAPASWEGPIRMLGGRVEVGTIQTRMRPDSLEMPRPSSRVEVRRLTLDDGSAFAEAVPPWALRSWGEFTSLITGGSAFGVPMPGGFASLAWTYETDLEHDKVGVATRPRYWRLGLGGAAASSLVDHILRDRRRSPLWVTNPANPGSIALAVSLGFSTVVEETLLRWVPRIEEPKM